MTRAAPPAPAPPPAPAAPDDPAAPDGPLTPDGPAAASGPAAAVGAGGQAGADRGETAAVARGGAANLVGGGVAAVCGVGVTWAVARGLGPAAAGGFFAAVAAFTLAGGVAKLGTSTSLVYWPARLRAGGTPELLREGLRAGLVPVGLAAAALGGLLWWAAPAIARATAEGHDPALVAEPLRALAVLLPAVALADTLLAATRGYRAMRPTVLLDRLARPALQLVGVGGLCLLAGHRPVPLWAFALAWAGPYLPTALAAARHLRRVHRAAVRAGGPRPPVDRAGRRAFRRRFWAFGWPRAVASVLQLALQRVDVLLVAALGGLGPAAAYAVAGRFVVAGQLANQAISVAVQPRLAEALSTGDTARAGELYRVATGWLVLATWPIHLLVLAFAPLYLGLFGPAYAGGGAVVAVLAGAMLLATGCGMVDMVLAMGGRTRWNLLSVGIALAALVAVGALAIPRLGALGAALGLAAAIAVNNLLPLARVRRELGLHPFGRGTLAAAGLAVAAFGALPAAATALLGRGWAGLGAALVLGGAAYAAGARLLRRPLALDALRTLRPRGGRGAGPSTEGVA
ncbi:hypothetical protein GCM10010123_31830 [Pilimelia anulata]|uniref:Polysaccharide biosynthesis protein C-terminal domain-containing protein n=1 Tax=Pilimelia anulata TaxID=53371 RepID=A0A8J3BAF2_9ACTN|nr:lipopolysaccharide biosynthesis protein [Pilimelia anulata]GGJ99565.1 hypothetical protein GCM10010123_31830 [Pilimelia anulata]